MDLKSNRNRNLRHSESLGAQYMICQFQSPVPVTKRLWRVLACVAAACLLVVGSALGDTYAAIAANLTDRSKLQTLKSRSAATDRMLKLIGWLSVAKANGREAASIVSEAQKITGETGARGALVKEAILRNLTIAERLGCLGPENVERMKHGLCPTITRGPYAGEPAEIDHILPVAIYPELMNEMANMELMPRTLNRRKGATIGQRQRAFAAKLRGVGLFIQKDSR